MRIDSIRIRSPIIETQTQRPNAGARANDTLHKTLSYPIGEPARQSACDARPKARHAPLAAYAALVVEGVQKHAFCLRKIIHLQIALASFTTAALERDLLRVVFDECCMRLAVRGVPKGALRTHSV